MVGSDGLTEQQVDMFRDYLLKMEFFDSAHCPSKEGNSRFVLPY